MIYHTPSPQKLCHIRKKLNEHYTCLSFWFFNKFARIRIRLFSNVLILTYKYTDVHFWYIAGAAFDQKHYRLIGYTNKYHVYDMDINHYI